MPATTPIPLPTNSFCLLRFVQFAKAVQRYIYPRGRTLHIPDDRSHIGQHLVCRVHARQAFLQGKGRPAVDCIGYTLHSTLVCRLTKEGLVSCWSFTPCQTFPKAKESPQSTISTFRFERVTAGLLRLWVTRGDSHKQLCWKAAPRMAHLNYGQVNGASAGTGSTQHFYAIALPGLPRHLFDPLYTSLLWDWATRRGWGRERWGGGRGEGLRDRQPGKERVDNGIHILGYFLTHRDRQKERESIHV